jgi:hypothetical protein
VLLRRQNVQRVFQIEIGALHCLIGWPGACEPGGISMRCDGQTSPEVPLHC